jgi:hypothetical protein
MSVYVRRFLQDPGDAVLLNIESVNILDLEPPSTIQGVGTGTVLLVGEFENGPYAKPQQLLGTTDLSRTWGTLGYQVGGLVAQYPSAPVRSADSAVVPESWNGNAFVQISGLQFATLIMCRVNTSVGMVTFSPLAFVEGAVEFAYSLTSGQELQLTLSTLATAVTAAGFLPQATISVESTTGFSGTGTFEVDGQTVSYTGTTPTSFTGCSGGTGFFGIGDVVLGGTLTTTAATFTGAPAVVEAVNTTVAVGSNGTNLPSAGVIDVASTTGFAGGGGDVTVDGHIVTYTGVSGGNSFTGCTRGGATVLATGDVVVAGQWPTSFAGGEQLTLAFDGNPNFTVFFQAGDQTLAQVIARINAYAGYAMASSTSSVILTLTGRLPGTTGSVSVVSGSSGVLAKLGLTAGITIGTGNVGNITQVKFTEVQSVVQGAISGVKVELNSSGALRVSNTATPGVGGIYVAGGTTATGLGLAVGEADGADLNLEGTLPAGTLVSDGGSTLLLTTQDLVITPYSVGPFSVPVRFAVDNGTGVGVSANAINTVVNPPSVGSFSVDNLLPVANAMTEAQIDAAYALAIQSTTDVNSVAKVANLIVSARQSNAVRSQLRQNVLFASANGCFGRMACLGPPLNTSPQVALGPAAPGVVATRDQRVIYCYVGANTFVPLIGQVGLAGGQGFTATGNVDVHSDTLMASILSQLPPEENPGQETTFTANVNGLETGPNVQGFDITSYQAFKAAGIAALRIDDGVAIFQSGVTSVDPSVSPQLVRIARRRMADFIEDSIAGPTKKYGKRLSLQARRKALKGQIRSFMVGLLAKNNPGAQRIAGFTVTDSDGNDDVTLSSGMYRITVKAKTLPSLDSIVIQATIGDDVTVDEVLPAAA